MATSKFAVVEDRTVESPFSLIELKWLHSIRPEQLVWSDEKVLRLSREDKWHALVWFHVCPVVWLKTAKFCICLSSFSGYFGLKGGLAFWRKYARLLSLDTDFWSFNEIIMDKHNIKYVKEEVWFRHFFNQPIRPFYEDTLDKSNLKPMSETNRFRFYENKWLFWLNSEDKAYCRAMRRRTYLRGKFLLCEKLWLFWVSP